MPRLLSRLQTSIGLAPRAVLSMTRLRKRNQPAVVNPPMVTSLLSTAVQVSASTPNSGRKVTRFGLRRVTRAATKDTFLLGLEALAESADAFPPLKSAVCGLLFFVRQADIVSGNKEQIADMRAQIDAMVVSIVRAIPDVTDMSPVAQEAVRALAMDVQAVYTEIEALVRQRGFLRFIRARQHSSRLERLTKRLAAVDATFTRTMLTSTEMKSTQILACVQPLREEVHSLLIQGRKEFFFFDTTCKMKFEVAVARPWLLSYSD
ncbi:unnamed protein product [Peniophora sp. CBMAI 1063]|nr:unnamed protein product [Peniophora sp. CBMAI 1063]